MPRTPSKKAKIRGRPKGSTSEATRVATAKARAARVLRAPIEGHAEFKLSVYGDPKVIAWFRSYHSRGMYRLIKWLFDEYHDNPRRDRPFTEAEDGISGG